MYTGHQIRKARPATPFRSWAIFAVILLCIAAAVAARAQTFTTLASLGSNLDGPLIQGTDGNFYGVTPSGGADNPACGSNGCGTVFKVTPTGTITIFHSFCSQANCADGLFPSSLIRGGDGNFYGVAGGHAGTSPSGMVFRITPSGTFTILYESDGFTPTTLMQAFSGGVYGDFYGTTATGGASTECQNGCGTVFHLTPQAHLTTLYSLCSQADCADGSNAGTLIQSAGGDLWGANATGGFLCSFLSTPCGTTFRMSPDGEWTTMHMFVFQNGFLPNVPLVETSDGTLYGTARYGGNGSGACPGQGCGTFFKMSPSNGHVALLYPFCPLYSHCVDGQLPNSVIEATDGSFYGTAYKGGTGCPVVTQYGTLIYGCGTIFRVSAEGTLATLYDFCAGGGNCSDGSYPLNALVQGTDGKFYGSTTSGGASGSGTLFSLDVGLAPFVTFLVGEGCVGKTVGILGQGFRNTTNVSFNGTPASFTVKSDIYLTAVVPAGATTGSVSVTTPSGRLSSNVAFRVTN